MSNIRWCSDSFEFRCDDGDRLRVAFALDCCRLRPILMTSLAALLGAIPLAFGHGAGSELRQPLGIAIVGGLAFSQLLTLYTTPVTYLWFERRRRAQPASHTPSQIRPVPAPGDVTLDLQAPMTRR